MKALYTILALMAVPALVNHAYGAENAVLQGLLPTNATMKTGTAVTPQFSPEFIKMQQELLNRLQNLSP